MTAGQDSIREWIINDLVTSLDAIKGGKIPDGGSSGYWFSTDFADRISRFKPEHLDLNKGKTLWFVATGREQPKEGVGGQKRWRSELEVLILGARYFGGTLDDELHQGKDQKRADTERNRLLKDGVRGLQLDHTRGRITYPLPVGNRQAASNTNMGPIRVDQGEFFPWILVEIALLIEYDFYGMEP